MCTCALWNVSLFLLYKHTANVFLYCIVLHCMLYNKIFGKVQDMLWQL